MTVPPRPSKQDQPWSRRPSEEKEDSQLSKSDAARDGDANPASAGSVTLAICAYTERRWDLLVQAVEHASAQLRAQDELILVIDYGPGLLASAAEAFPQVRVLGNEHAPGLSGARNTAVGAAHGDVIAFLDDDAVPAPEWLETLRGKYVNPSVVGAGGQVCPIWSTEAPWWVPAEFFSIVGCSYSGLPTSVAEIRNPIGASMSFRRAAVGRADLSSESLGRIGTVPAGCKETELSLRIIRELREKRILHQPEAVVGHHVSPERASFSYFRRRCWSEGASEAVVSRLVQGHHALATERAYVTRTLGKPLVRELGIAVRGDPRGIVRACVVIVGVVFMGAGYVGHLGTGRSARKV
jgi:GT2 family glycosyltransferase